MQLRAQETRARHLDDFINTHGLNAFLHQSTGALPQSASLKTTSSVPASDHDSADVRPPLSEYSVRLH